MSRTDTDQAGWQVGDLAMCVAAGHWWAPAAGRRPASGWPRRGGIHTVRAVDRSGPEAGAVYLVFPEWPRHAWEARCFRKLRPLTDEERRREEVAGLAAVPVEPAVAL